MSKAYVGTGAIIRILDDIGGTPTVEFEGEIIAATVGGISTEIPDATALSTGDGTGTASRKFVSGSLSNPGEVSLEVLFDPSDQVPWVRPTVDEFYTLEINFVQAAADAPAQDLWQCTGFVTGFELGVPLEDLMTATLTFKRNSDWTLA